MRRTDQQGMAIVIAMFMTLLVSALGAAMVHVARTETLSSANYTSMSQARYAAESGLAAAANYLLSDAYETVAPGTAGDPLSNYDTNVSPVVAGGGEVILSSDPDVESNYPVAEVVGEFADATFGLLEVGQGEVRYAATARLLGMRQITEAFSGRQRTLQTWEITGIGRQGQGQISGEVEVRAIIERSTRPVFNYAAFATGSGCGAIAFTGNASTRSYDSRELPPDPRNEGGHIGSNGNLSGGGSADIYGTMSTPRAGVGNCTANNVTAATMSALGTVHEGLIQLPQPIEFPSPDPVPPGHPTNSQSISGSGCPSGTAGFCASGPVFTPPDPTGNTPVLLGNLSISGNSTVTLKAGTYIINSLSISGNSKIVVDSASNGPVRIVLAGQGSVDPVFNVSGNGISNTTWDPNNLRIEYAGTKTMNFSGNGDTAAIVYAPNAVGNFSGNADFFGTVIMNTMNFSGNTRMTYDRALQQSAVTAGNFMMTTFTWRTF